MWPLLAAGAGLGLIKSFAVDKPRENAQRGLAAATARYSPWTGLNPQSVNVPFADPLGSAMQGGMTGAMVSNLNPDLMGGEAQDGGVQKLKFGSAIAPQIGAYRFPWQQS